MAGRVTRHYGDGLRIRRERLPSKITKETRSANRLRDIRFRERGEVSRVEREYEKSRTRKR